LLRLISTRRQEDAKKQVPPPDQFSGSHQNLLGNHAKFAMTTPV